MEPGISDQKRCAQGIEAQAPRLTVQFYVRRTTSTFTNGDVKLTIRDMSSDSLSSSIAASNLGWRSLPPQRTVRVAPLLTLPDLLREFGVTPGPFLRRFGLSESALSHPDNTIPFDTMGHLLKACARATACPHFGLLLGQRSDASAFGALGFFIRNAPDVATALKELVMHLDLHDRGATSFLNVAEQTTVLGYKLCQPDMEGSDQINDGALAVAWNMMRALCGPEWLPVQVQFRRAPPGESGVWQRFFQAPLLFNAEHAALVFDTSFLTRKVHLADPLLRHYFMQRIVEMRRYSDLSLQEKAHQALLLLIGSQRCTLDQLANSFSMHPRTLNRRLRDAGTSFRELHHRARHETARSLLRDSGNSIEAIATLLGYSRASAFNRAFALWEGVPPANWRKRAVGK